MPSTQATFTSTRQTDGKAQSGRCIPDRTYFQDLLSTLQLSGHYKGQVEAFYWEQRRTIRHLKAVRPRLTRAQAQTALREFNDDLPRTGPKKWQAGLLEMLLLDTSLVTAAFQDIVQRRRETAGR